MDTRFHQLRAVLAYEGLSASERTYATDFLEAPATRAALVTALLRGALAERGHLLDNLKAARYAGATAGRVLLSWLLTSNACTAANPGGVLTTAQVQRGTVRLNNAAVTAAELLELLVEATAAIRARQTLRPAALPHLIQPAR